MNSIKEILIQRDNMSNKEAENLIKDMKEDLMLRLDDPDVYGYPENVLRDWVGLEPDYLDELLF